MPNWRLARQRVAQHGRGLLAKALGYGQARANFAKRRQANNNKRRANANAWMAAMRQAARLGHVKPIGTPNNNRRKQANNNRRRANANAWMAAMRQGARLGYVKPIGARRN